MSIPASRIVTVNPGVLSAGGRSLVMNGLFLTQNTQMPTGTVLSFASPQAVAQFFGPASAEAAAASIYFGGYSTSTVKPGNMLFAAFNLAARAAFLQGGSLASTTLAQLQAMDGTLTLTVDGVAETSGTINLAAATSFSNAAAIITAGFTSPGFTVAWNPIANAFVFTTTTTGATATLTFATGTLAGGLKLSAQSGGILSQGAVADTPATALANAVAGSQNFGTVVTLWEPDLADKQNFAVWFNAQNNRYLWLGWDSDPNASVQGNETCFGYLALQADYNGIAIISGDPVCAAAQGVTLASLVMNVAIFAAGAVASINFSATNGRTALAFLSQAGIAPTVTNDQTAQNLLANGYNFYGTYATANQSFTFFYNGQMPGAFAFADSFINQVWINSQFQLALMTLVTQVDDIPYNPAGYGLIRSALTDPINAAISFGAIRTNVTLSAQEVSDLNNAAGVNAAALVQTFGYYLQIADPGAQARAARQTPIVNFWYADGGAVQQITLDSINVQ